MSRCDTINFVLLGWYIGVALELVICYRLIRRGWARRLPFFFGFLFVALAGNFALLATRGTPLYATIYKLGSPLGLTFQFAASIEAFWWCASELPKFRRIATYLMLLCTGAALGLQHWTKDVNIPGLALESLAELERIAGFALFFFLSLALLVYAHFDRIPASARRHSACLALMSIVNAIGWKMVQSGGSRSSAALIITWGTAACWLAWLALITEGPARIEHETRPIDREGIDRFWKKADTSAGL